MFWAAVLPFQITVVLLFSLVMIATVFAPRMMWNRMAVFGSSLGFAMLAFIPCFIIVGMIVDQFRFGEFHHATYADVGDFRIYRYLPLSAKKITLHKFASGHNAKYSIAETELATYVDDAWEKYGHHSSIPRKKAKRGEPDQFSSSKIFLKQNGWSLSVDSVVYEIPYAANGAGATYYYDRATGTAYHEGGYW